MEKEGWPYAIERQNGKKLVTSHHLMLTVDGSQKDFHMNSVSNSMPTEVSSLMIQNGIGIAKSNRSRSQTTRTLWRMKAKLSQLAHS